MMYLRNFISCFFLMAMVLQSCVSFAYAQEEMRETKYMSLRNSETYMRYGPSTNYPIKWIYLKKRLPIKILNDFDQWKKVQDAFGEEGWIHSALLSSKATALVVTKEKYTLVYDDNETDSIAVLRVEPGVIVDIEDCSQTHCEVSVAGYEGFVEKKYLWGIE
ncbi:MAG: hypothetical protein CMH28_04425 [Micavibrio sp.]|nr:hypothetical protein [Micavibrio sp.]